MTWIENLLFTPSSVAHTVLLYAFVIAAGVYLGKMKIFGISLGVTFVLFVGLLAGHFGFVGEANIMHFMQEFGLILFVYSIGLQVGPGFFSSFKRRNDPELTCNGNRIAQRRRSLYHLFFSQR